MSPRKRGEHPSRNSRRRRPLKQTILIVCEGKETERNYFEALKKQDRFTENYTITVKKGKGGSREQIAKHAVKRKNDHNADYDEVWCVMDVEGPSHRDSLEKAVKLLKENGITLCLSNPAFEVWLLAHFKRVTRSFKDCNAVIVELNKSWERHFKAEYQKNNDQVFSKLSPFLDTAMANAEWVRNQHQNQNPDKQVETADCNSSTDVDMLVGKLLK